MRVFITGASGHIGSPSFPISSRLGTRSSVSPAPMCPPPR